MWDEVDLPVKAKPSPGESTIRRLDSACLVLDGNPQVSAVIGMGLLTQIGGLFFLRNIWWEMQVIALGKSFATSTGKVLILTCLFMDLVLLVAIPFSLWLCYQALIVRSPAPIVFNRRTGQVLGSHRGKRVVLDWKRVRPVLTRAKVMYSGAQTHYHLVLMNFDAGQEGPMKKKTGFGMMVATGGAYGGEECRALWEFIRRYMEGKPRDLPPVELTPDTDGWVSKVLDVGPYWEFTEPQNRTMEVLRARKGRPVFPHFWIWALLVLLSLPLLFNLWQIFIRPRVKHPAEWLPAVPTEPSSYATSQPNPEDRAIRRKAAYWVIALWWCGAVGLGSVFWISFMRWL